MGGDKTEVCLFRRTGEECLSPGHGAAKKEMTGGRWKVERERDIMDNVIVGSLTRNCVPNFRQLPTF